MCAHWLAHLVLAAICANVVEARLLEPARSLAPDAELYSLPVIQFFRHEKAKANLTRSGAWALRGIPTHYTASGCRKVSETYGKVTNPYGGATMSVARCFAFCAKRKGVSYFGLTGGNQCSCGASYVGPSVGESSCESACPGNPREMCGGIEGTSLYVMYDCTKDTKEEVEKEKADKKKALINSYGAFDGETCGQDKDNVVKLDDKGYLSGSVDKCKIACWTAKGAEGCHGFTYDAVTSKCTFHYDVTAGSVKKNAKASCYFKVV